MFLQLKYRVVFMGYILLNFKTACFGLQNLLFCTLKQTVLF
ncbi:hypothetical protein HMPREF0653_00906 [Prevotella disiens JCM 6334 = ATCC 29426]|uniref:Uncharacterized protein n=1 Tax=Prevotella disiens JCM 6334 = ATCC 29426 TaxID=1235811 RepID=A0ABP2Y8M7_9BACT|nr:hypothetical protein HMPREF0653_00906 [Prevotella disiens JCM 6334 = ATCC 29426]